MTGKNSVPRCHHSKDFVKFIKSTVGNDRYTKKVASLADSVIGCTHSATLGVRMIGIVLAKDNGLETMSAMMQAERFLFDDASFMSKLLRSWIRLCLADKKKTIVTMEWIQFEKDKYATFSISSILSSGKQRPLFWRTYSLSMSQGERFLREKECISEFCSITSKERDRIHFAADKGSSGVDILRLLTSHGFFCTIRLPSDVRLTDRRGRKKTLSEWAPKNGSARLLRGAHCTGQEHDLSAIAVKQELGSMEPLALATNDPQFTAKNLVQIHRRRITDSEFYFDLQDLPSATMDPTGSQKCLLNRDRCLWLGLVAHALMPLLGQAGEDTGLDRRFRGDTRRKREHSLLRQSVMYYQALLTLRDSWAKPLISRFGQIIEESDLFSAMAAAKNEGTT